MYRRHPFVICFLLFCFAFSTSCSKQQDKQSFTLGDLTMHTYVPGDSLIYSIVSGTRNSPSGIKEFLGEVVVNFDRSSISSYPDSSNASALSSSMLETSTVSTSDQSDEITQRHFYQDNTGSSYLFLLESENSSLWIKPKDQAIFSIKTMSSPLVPEQMVSPQFDVYSCNPLCEVVGSGSEELSYVGVENITTPYAKFETYAFSYTYNLSISRSDLTSITSSIINGKKWIYPGVGIVMYSVSSESVYYVAALHRTNIKISTN